MNSEKRGIGGLQASLTVEACFVASLTVIVLTAFLFCAFYVHDRAGLYAKQPPPEATVLRQKSGGSL